MDRLFYYLIDPFQFNYFITRLQQVLPMATILCQHRSLKFEAIVASFCILIALVHILAVQSSPIPEDSGTFQKPHFQVLKGIFFSRYQSV